jgi:hypothetical protein
MRRQQRRQLPHRSHAGFGLVNQQPPADHDG